MSAAAEPVLLSLDDGIARLRLNRPEASNGLDVPLLQALHAALMRCHGEPSLRVLLLTGEGRNFCAGGDIKDFAAKGEALPDYLREATAWLSFVTQALISLPAPVVTLVQGFAAGGGGIGMVCASDIVIAGESARFMSGATRVGMAPDGGSSVTLSRLIGHRRALEFVLLKQFFTELTPERWRPQLAINLEGVLNVTHAALPAMQAARYGRIINVSSEAGRLGSKRGAVYAAAKAGVIAFTKSIARENARYGITANNVLPGPIETPMLEANRQGPRGEEVVAAMAGATLLGRIGDPEEVAAAVAFLASDRAAYITGETLGVSGGMGIGVS